MDSRTSTGFIQRLKSLNIKVDTDLLGSQFTTYRIGGPISYCVRLRTDNDLLSLAEVISNGYEDVLHQENVCVVGNGSNILIDDKGFNGYVFVLENDLSQIGEVKHIPDLGIQVSARAGLSLPMFARKLVQHEIGGLEFFVGIPGTVGGAVAMNAGGHGKQTSEVLKSAKVLNLKTGSWKTYATAECNFRYRSSCFVRTDLIVSAEFIGEKKSSKEIKDSLDEIVAWRRENQPGGRNVGSVFQNPSDISAGALIEKCGLKGFRIGSASVSHKHANFIQAEQDGKAKDVNEVIAHIQKVVFETTGYELKTEVRYISNDE